MTSAVLTNSKDSILIYTGESVKDGQQDELILGAVCLTNYFLSVERELKDHLVDLS